MAALSVMLRQSRAWRPGLKRRSRGYVPRWPLGQSLKTLSGEMSIMIIHGGSHGCYCLWSCFDGTLASSVIHIVALHGSGLNRKCYLDPKGTGGERWERKVWAQARVSSLSSTLMLISLDIFGPQCKGRRLSRDQGDGRGPSTSKEPALIFISWPAFLISYLLLFKSLGGRRSFGHFILR